MKNNSKKMFKKLLNHSCQFWKRLSMMSIRLLKENKESLKKLSKNLSMMFKLSHLNATKKFRNTLNPRLTKLSKMLDVTLNALNNVKNLKISHSVLSNVLPPNVDAVKIFTKSKSSRTSSHQRLRISLSALSI